MDLSRRLLMALGFQTLDLLMEFVTPPQLTYTTLYQLNTKLLLDLKILLASEKLTKTSNFSKN
jgi:hypothetical protein